MKRGIGPVVAMIGLALALLASLYWYASRVKTGASAANLLLAEAGRILGSPARQGPELPDLNRNGAPEVVYYLPFAGATTATTMQRGVVLELQRRKPKVVLLLGPEGLFSNGTTRIVDQVPAAGYQVDWPTDSANRTIQVALLGADGAVSSDAIALSWDAQAGAFQPVLPSMP